MQLKLAKSKRYDTENFRGSFKYLHGYSACNPSNENLISFKNKKTLEVLSMKNTLPYLGKFLVVSQST